MNKNKVIQLSSKVLRISESKDGRYIELEMFVSDNEANLNGVLTTEKFLRAKSDTLVDMPLVVDRPMLESGFTNSLTHKFDGENLNTDIIGIFKETYLSSNENNIDYISMYARAIVYTRFPNTVNAIKQLFEEDNLKFSWELIATDVEERDGIAYINDGFFEGHAIVSSPAYSDKATATKLVAEAFAKDINDTQTSEIIESDLCEQEEDSTKEGGKAIEMKDYLAEILKEKSMEQIKSEISGIIQAGLNEDEYVYVMSMYPNQLACNIYTSEDWDGKFYRMPYSVAENVASVDMENKKEIISVWMDKEGSSDDMMVSEIKERELSTAKSELETKVSELEEKVRELSEAQPTEPTEPVVEPTEPQEPTEPNEKDVELAEKVISLSDTVSRLESEIESLRPYKEKAEQEAEEKRIAEEEANKTRLSEMVKKFTKEDEIPEEVATMISELDEKGVKLWIAEEAIKVVSVEEDDEPIVVETPEENTLVESEEEFELV